MPRGERVAHAQQRDVLDAGDQVAHLARAQRVDRGHARPEEADLVDLGLRAGLHRDYRVVLAQLAVDHPDVGDHAAVLVELGVEDERARRGAGVALGRIVPAATIASSSSVTPIARLGRDADHLVGGLAQQLRDLAGHALGLGARQVDLVQGRDQLEPGFDRQVGVGHGLRLDALGGVDHQQRAVAGGQRARHLVGEVDVAGRVDQVQPVGLPVLGLVLHPHRLGLDRDAALALELHRVEQLGAVVAGVDRAGGLEDAVGQRRLPMVDVGDDREVADVLGGARHRPVKVRRATSSGVRAGHGGKQPAGRGRETRVFTLEVAPGARGGGSV